MKVRKLEEVPVAEQSTAVGVAFVGYEIMVEQRDAHRNAQEVHGLRQYPEIFHCHPLGHECRGLCEFWSPE